MEQSQRRAAAGVIFTPNPRFFFKSWKKQLGEYISSNHAQLITSNNVTVNNLMCDVCWVSDIHNDLRILLSVRDVVSLVTQITETGYEGYTTMQYVLYVELKKRQAQRRAATEAAVFM